MEEKTVVIKKGDLVDAMVDLMHGNERVKELISRDAMFCLLLPCIAIELEAQLGLTEITKSEEK